MHFPGGWPKTILTMDGEGARKEDPEIDV